MDEDDLTYEQKYEIDFSVRFEDSETGIKIDYAGCGSHAVNVTGKIDLDQAKALLARLSALPGIAS